MSSNKTWSALSYTITFLWIFCLLFPFFWMVSTSLKDTPASLKTPPSLLPDVPQKVNVDLKYQSQANETQMKQDAATVIWTIADQFKQDHIGSFSVRSIENNRIRMVASGLLYQVQNAKDRFILSVSPGPSDIVKASDDLLKTISVERVDQDYTEQKREDENPLLKKINDTISRLPLAGKISTVTANGDPTAFVNSYSRAYSHAFEHTGRTFGDFILNSVTVSLAVVVLQLFISSLAAYALSHLVSPAVARWLLLFFVATLMIPPILLFIPLYNMMSGFPFKSIPFTSIPFPNINLLNSYWPLILPYTAWGLSILVLKGFFDQISKQTIEAARIDGASEFKIYWKIVMPLSKPILGVMAILTYIAVFDDFFWPYIVAQDPKVWTYPVALYYAQSSMAEPNVTMALAVIAAVPTVLLAVIFQKHIEKGISFSGLKG